MRSRVGGSHKVGAFSEKGVLALEPPPPTRGLTVPMVNASAPGGVKNLFIEADELDFAPPKKGKKHKNGKPHHDVGDCL